MFDNAAGVGHKGYGEREPRPAAPVPRVPGALRVRLLVGQPVFRPREGRGGVQGRHGAAQAVRAPAERMEPGELQRRAAGPVPGAGHETALPQGHGGTWPVLRGPCGAAAVAREAFSTSAAWRHMKADQYGAAAPGDGIAVPRTGRTRAESRSWASARSRPGVLDSSGKHLATHPRAYGQAGTNSEDPPMQLALLCNKPASWPNSRVRDVLPDPLRQWLDRQDRQTRNEALQTLKRVDRESGWANTVKAMLSILEPTGGADRAGAALLAARLAEGVAGIEYDDDRPDPGEYDIASVGDAGVQGGGRRARRRTKGSTGRPASCSSPRRASTNSPAGPRPARSTPSTACPTRNWPTGNARSTTGSCAAPGPPSSRASTATTSRTPGSPTATRPGELLGLGFIPRAQDLVFYGKTGRGKTHLAIGLGMKAIDMGLGVRFHRTAELVPPAGQGQTRRHARDDAPGTSAGPT